MDDYGEADLGEGFQTIYDLTDDPFPTFADHADFAVFCE